MTIALTPLSTATVHTLKGTIETLPASAFEAEKTTTVYGEHSLRGVVSTQVENGELKQRLLGLDPAKTPGAARPGDPYRGPQFAGWGLT